MREPQQESMRESKRESRRTHARRPRTLLRIAGFCVGFVTVLFVAALLYFVVAAELREREPASALAPPTGQFVQTARGRLFIQQWGPADGRPVIFTHGTAAWSEFWRDTAMAVGAAGYRAIALDLPPFGFSDHDLRARYSRADQAERLIALLDALQLPSATLVGHSFGSGSVAEALLRHPDRIEQVLFIAAALALPDNEGPAPAPGMAVRALAASLPPRAVLTALTATNPLLTHTGLAMMLARKEAATDARVRILQLPLARRGTTTAYAKWLPFLLLADPEALSMQPSAYAKIATPTALLWGAADTVTPIEQGRRLAVLIPGASLDIIEGVGHIPHIEAPEETLKWLLRRLNRP